jgi:hypothetical protein
LYSELLYELRLLLFGVECDLIVSGELEELASCLTETKPSQFAQDKKTV